jgi:hypothetical protein
MQTTGMETPLRAPLASVSRVQVEQLRQLVARNARRWRRLVILEALGLAISAPLAYLWLIFLIDTQVHLPTWGRWLASLTFFAGIVALGAWLVRRWRQIHLTEDQVALAIERRTMGGVQNRLINAVQIARDGCGDIELGEAVVEENYRHLQQMELQQAAQSKPALVLCAIAGVVVLVGLLGWAWRPDQFTNAASRILLPFADIDPIYRTTLEVTPGDVIAMGDVAIEIKIHGQRPETLAILTNILGKRSVEEVPVDADSDVVTYTFRDVQQSMTYAVRGNDFTTPYFKIDVPTAPQLSLLRVSYLFPEYTRLGERKFEKAGGDLEALQGTKADVVFVFDQPADEAVLLVERVAEPASETGRPSVADAAGSGDPRRARTVVRQDLRRISPTEFAGSLTFQNVAGYSVETTQAGQSPHLTPRYVLRVQTDQEPKLELVGLDRQTEVQVDSRLPLQISASDDYGLEKVGLFVRRAGAVPQGEQKDEDPEGWQPVVVWPAKRDLSLRQEYALAIDSLKASEGEKLEIALRGVDTDPLKKGRWSTGAIYTLLVGGEGVALQLTYEQLLKTEADLKEVIKSQQAVQGMVKEWLGKLDGDGGLRWDDPKNLDALHAAAKSQRQAQEQVRKNAGAIARGMVPQAAHLRISVGLLADTEMVRAMNILDSVPARDTPQAKRSALADTRLTMERTARSLQEILDHVVAFRLDWEVANMTPFTKMLAERQAKLAALSQSHADKGGADAQFESVTKRQEKVLGLCELIQPAFDRIADRLKQSEPIIATAYAAGGKTLQSDGLKGPMKQAVQELKAKRWSTAASRQAAAAKELAELHARLRKAQVEAAQQVLAALQAAAKNNADAQAAIDQLKAGTAESGVKNFPEKAKVSDIIRMREVAGARKRTAEEDARTSKLPTYDPIDINKLELLRDSGVRQDPGILSLGKVPEKSMPIDPGAADRERNKVRPFVQTEFEDLVGKLLDELDELTKDFQTLTLSTNQNNSDPGDIGKQGGRLNSTGAVTATGNKKPPTTNHGGVARMGRSGARAYGSVLGNEGVARKGRDKAQEGEERAPDQPGSIREKKSDDPYTDTSTGVGGKKVDSDDTHFSTKDAGKWNEDMIRRMGAPQKKNYIVERQGDKFDPRMAELLRDMTSRQEQVIERIKAIRKELRTLYLPTDHLDKIEAQLRVNMERLKDRPDSELFRMQMQTLDRLAGTVKVFHAARAGIQPSLPRERMIHGRVFDEPSRQTLPGYEDAVKRYYEKLAR